MGMKMSLRVREITSTLDIGGITVCSSRDLHVTRESTGTTAARLPVLLSTQSRTYTRNLVDEGNGRFNLMVLCWGEGHGSAIHDHADAHCVMKILKGKLCETRYAWPTNSEAEENIEELKELERNTLEKNEICYINDSMGLHRVENPSATNPAVSLHLYSPPFSMCSVFNKQTGQKSTCKVTFWSKFGEKRNREIQDTRPPEDN